MTDTTNTTDPLSVGNTPGVVYMYLTDPAFINQSTPVTTHLQQGSLCNISQVGLSYFLDLGIYRDRRDPTTRNVTIPHNSVGSLLFDNEIDPTDSLLITGAPDSFNKALFDLTDCVFFNTNSNSSLSAVDTALQALPSLKGIYQAGTVKLPKTQSQGVYYDSANNGQTISTWGYVEVTLAVPSGTNTQNVVFHIYISDSQWQYDYPYSQVMAVAPPMEYSDLLYLDLQTATGNRIADTTTGFNLAKQLFNDPQSKETATGYDVFTLNGFADDQSWEVPVSFGYIYKGQEPSVTQIRQAIRKELENSGVGTPEQWKRRFPDLYLIGRFYLVPLWDGTYKLPDDTIYKGIVSRADSQDKVNNIFPTMSLTYLQSKMEDFTSPYNLIHICSIPDPSNDPTQNIPSLISLHPSYREVQRDNYAFSYMKTETQRFSSALIEVLTILSGNQTKDQALYPMTRTRHLNYISFSVNEIEFAVVAPDSYQTAQDNEQS